MVRTSAARKSGSSASERYWARPTKDPVDRSVPAWNDSQNVSTIGEATRPRITTRAGSRRSHGKAVESKCRRHRLAAVVVLRAAGSVCPVKPHVLPSARLAIQLAIDLRG